MELDELSDDRLKLIMREEKGIGSELAIGSLGRGDPSSAGESEGCGSEWAFGDVRHRKLLG